MIRLYAATSSEGKLRDFAWAAAQHAGRFLLEPLPGLAQIPAPPEDEPTFEGNARVKAMYYSLHAPGALVLADDSGLEVVCLKGRPGVRSARYAEDQHFPHPPLSTVDERNNAALLRALDGVPDTGRDANYRCVLALARDGEVLEMAEGRLDGTILFAPRGKGGFGYDPLFEVPELGRTMAEIEPASRMEVSHRARALRSLLVRLGDEMAD